MVGIEEKQINAGECTVHYLEAGSRQGRSMVLLHGMKFQAETWRELKTIETLAGAGFHVIALDMPGFGKSAACNCAAGEVLRNFLVAKELGKPVLVGPSMGGRICLEFAIDFPEMTGGLVLVGAVGVEENRKRLAGLKMPCLIVWGGEDAISPIENGRLLHKEIKHSQFLVLEGAPHPCYLEKTEQWHSALLVFLKEYFV